MAEMAFSAEEVELLHNDLQNSESENRRLRREIARLKGEMTKQRRQDPAHGDARDLFEYWRDELGKNANVVYGEKREKQALAMLKLFSLEQLQRAIDGCKLLPFVGPHGRQADGTKGAKRHDEFVLILRDETTVERFIGYAEEDAEERDKRRARNIEIGIKELIRTNGRNYEDPDMPRAYPDALRSVLAALGDRNLTVTGSGSQYMAQCPSHDDRNPSLSITEKPDGAVLLNCFAGCDMQQVASDLLLDWHNLWGSGYRKLT